jgi:hypothetical protein
MTKEILSQYGILDLGGKGELQIELEYIDKFGMFQEGIFSIDKKDIKNFQIYNDTVNDAVYMILGNPEVGLPTVLTTHFPTGCSSILEMRKPEVKPDHPIKVFINIFKAWLPPL